jgi:hypothetical protein
MPFGEIERMADAFAKSNLFGFKTKEQALVLMMISQAEGRHPALAARDYDVYQNKPAKKAEAMLRDFQASGGVVKWHELTDERADATFSHPQAPEPLRLDWDMARAKKAGLAGKDLWGKYTRSMLRSRLVSEGVRAVWPGATSGMYVPEEMAAMTQEPPHNGPTLEHEPTPTPPEPKPETRREAINRDVPLNPTPPPTGDATPTMPANMPGYRDFLKSLETAMRGCSSIQEVDRVIAQPKTQYALATYKDDGANQLKAIIAAGIAAHAAAQHPPVPPSSPPDAVADIWGDASSVSEGITA